MKKVVQSSISDFKAATKLLLQKRKKRNSGPIRVGFIGQYIPAWNKAEGLYREMLADSRFEPVIVCVPSGISEHKLNNPDSLENNTYEYYKNNGYNAVNTLIGRNEWLDLGTLDLDYIFYQRPYDYHLPLQYASSVVSKYSKICVLLYAAIMVEEDVNICLDKDFFRNVYCYFADSPYAANANRNHFKLSHFLGIRKSLYLGNPSSQHILSEKSTKTDVWNAIGDGIKIMWTPRWTTDLKLGGTNFFEYKDFFLDFAKKNAKASVMVRPHPLAFENFIRAGDMTQSEVDLYKETCNLLPNTEIDTRKDYINTMWSSDMLVSDISGILPEYFIMNKPLIFCASNMILKTTEFTKRMLDGCYVVNNKQELEACLASLMAGIDPLKEKRTEIISELFSNKLDTCIQDILNLLAIKIK